MDAAAHPRPGFEPLLTAFVCNWCTYTGADLAGTSRLMMAPNVRIFRLPCTGRIDPLFLIKAFERGADGIIVSGCHPADCHYTSGNYHARRRFALFRELLLFFGVEPDRVTFSWVSASEGGKWQQVVDRATARVRELGPFTAYCELTDPWDGEAAVVSGSGRRQELGHGRGEPWQTAIEGELRELAGRLLAAGEVAVVIGWEEGPGGVRPAFVTQPDGSNRLVFDRRCVHNLAVYLTRHRGHVRRLGRPAVVVKGCDARAVAGLLREHQITRDELVLIGIRCPGVIRGGTGDHPGAVADRCGGCDARTPRLVDHLLGELPPPPLSSESSRRLAALEAATPAERWSFWRRELDRCLRCHACRQVCPLCHCERCVANSTRPQWIEPSAHGRGNLAWHLIRALHLAGRCAGCDECERACPVGIPLGLIQRKLAQEVAERFRYRVGDDPTVPAPLGTFDRDDPQEFIL